MIEKAVVNKDGSIKFVFYNGTEITSIWICQRKHFVNKKLNACIYYIWLIEYMYKDKSCFYIVLVNY